MNGLDTEDETELQPQSHRGVTVAIRNQPEITWTDGDGSHRQILNDRMIVGSASSVGLVINDPTVSRIHAEFDPREDGLWVRDLGSRNGTFVEGVRVSGALVPEGGLVALGSTTLLVRYARESTPVELWPGEEFGRLIGRSIVMRTLFARIARVAASEFPVLIHGETGTGKELVARALHDASPRKSHPFVVVDCAALPEHLLESELFGHARGAFTGASDARAGAIETAAGGTVFLDEIGELPLAMQPKLLRVLESHTIRRIGESQHRHIDVRFVAATHRDLRKMVNSGAFREDLYFRLAVLPLTVPPLRERPEDIEPLVQYFLERDGGNVSAELARDLSRRTWLGNVRELRNFIHRTAALGAHEALALEAERDAAAAELPTLASESPLPTPAPPAKAPVADADAQPRLPISHDQPFKDFKDQLHDFGEREYLAYMLARYERNVTAIAEFAGLHRTYIYRLIRKHNL